MRSKLAHVRDRTNRQPQLPQALHVDDVLKCSADVACRLAGPDHIAEISGRVIERIYFEACIVRAGNKRVARSQARAQNAKSLTSLRLQPIETAADVDYTLTTRIECASD